MLNEHEIAAAGSYVEFLRLAVHDRDLPGTRRVRAAAGCLAIAQEHHHAIIRLIEERLYASSFALVRAAFEAYVRGEWLSRCASDEQVEAFIRDEEPPPLKHLLAAIEAIPAFQRRTLSQIKEYRWKAMCAYTHTGGLHVQRWNTEDGIEANYSREEILEVVQFADILGSLSVVGIAALANDDEMASRVLDGFEKRMAA